MSKKKGGGGFACMCGFNMLKMFDSAEHTVVPQFCFLPWITIIDLLQRLNWTLFLQRESYTVQLLLLYMTLQPGETPPTVYLGCRLFMLPQ